MAENLTLSFFKVQCVKCLKYTGTLWNWRINFLVFYSSATLVIGIDKSACWTEVLIKTACLSINRGDCWISLLEISRIGLSIQ